MPAPLRLDLVHEDATTYVFDSPGELARAYVREHNDGAEPRTLRRIVETWTITGARILSQDDSDPSESVQARGEAFLALLEDRDANPFTSARLVRTATATVHRTLGSGSQEGFAITSVEFAKDPDNPGADGVASLYVNLTLEAFRQFSAGVGANNAGIATWEQTVAHRYGPSGLHVLEWVTTLSVAEGAATTAVEQAELHAAIPMSDYGPTYVWDTNGDQIPGCEWEELDPDTSEDPDRTATRIKVVSRIRQLGVSVGLAAAGNSVGDFSLELETTEEAGRVTRVTRASAIGPGALALCRDQRPTGDLRRSYEWEDQAKRLARVEYVRVDDSASTRRELRLELAGGGNDGEFVAIDGNLAPIWQEGPRIPYRLTVTVRVVSSGARPVLSDMLYPERLPAPAWRLLRSSSREDPGVALRSPGAGQGQDEWERVATLVYQGADPPTAGHRNLLADETRGVETYALQAATA